MRALMGAAIAGAIVWGFALIGIASVAATLTAPQPAAPAAILSGDRGEWDSRHVPGLPSYPGSMDRGFRRDVLGTLVRTTSASSTTDPLEVVHAYYERLLREGAWTATAESRVDDGLRLTVEADGREGVIALHEQGPFTIIEIEMSEAAEARGEASHR